ncbi:transcription-repair coupling factor [Candidatus Ruthia endofausta]|uniref:Transcription-repair-coupling factor n=1 Tax=Candidatus Ruthia endofausta TaxID=2738852 RepID=A0A6N0HQI8_9GAMM|nr:transcription-repair coupling factor [Candidatus Ruthia endofausta]QKQ24520.1 transcription-repair coupling factor [Candidatus Ruthia endofausta]
MQYLYPYKSKCFQSGQKTYWGSLYGSADALALIEFANQQQQVILVIANDIAHFDSLYKSLNFYNTDLEILKFDNWEVLAYDHFSPHPDITSSRLKTLSKLKNLKRGIVLTTLESLFSHLCPLEFGEKYSFNIGINDNINLDTFSERLLKIGYNRVTTVMEHGEFNVRSSLIDLYPMGAKTPYRIDLFDQEVESIRTFDTSTQRSKVQVSEIALLPAREFPTDNASIERFKTNYQKAFNDHSFIYTEVSEGRLPGGIEFYLPLFFNTTNTLFDYLVNNAVIATSKGFSNLVDKTYSEIRERFENAKKTLDRAPLDIHQVFLSKELLFSEIKQKSQLIISTSKLEEKNQHFNFNSSLLSPIRIEPKTKNPLNKFLIFVKRFTNKKSKKILIVCESYGRQDVLSDLLIKHNLDIHSVKNWHEFSKSNKPLNITHEDLTHGLFTNDIAIVTEEDLFGQEVVQQQRRRRAKHKDFDEAIKSLVEIRMDDAIVHENYGVGRYLGLKTQIFDGQSQDFLALEYADKAKLMVPITSLNLISRYAGISPDSAPLHKLGTNQWSKAKKKSGEALFDVAAELLEIYAKRASQTGFAFPEPNDAYSSFVASFPFEETPDQLKTMGEVLADMQSHKPMDRLVCGDVGFGKTEIAMRAAFLAVEADKQVAILVPTTLLSNQHYQSFVDRFTSYPVEIAALSRFQTPKEQRIIIEKLNQGKIDIVIGTHKIIQGTIKYKNLGLVIIDEEHRFGVKQKEALKKLRGESDVLTMTATPIPRTLNMALGSLRELSIIATPPAKRSAIQTFVQEWSNNNIKEAITREIHRGGQIFVLHNDIDSIDNMAKNLEQIIPKAHVRIAHGQMPTRELERIMSDFYHACFQILVCTTIIETGIDIPNANTIIINNAQKFGLAQLHQLRGRVGRSHHRAYAYLIVKSHQSLSRTAKKRLDAIESLKELGTGFMLANHDLEIRGAGDLLGDNQSGKISEIGFNLYHDLLKRTIDAMRSGRKINLNDPINHEVQINSGLPSIIPETYIFDVHERLVFYKRIANCQNNKELKALQIEMIDRFGLLPDSTKNLFVNIKLKLFSEKIGIDEINLYEDKAIITFGSKNTIEPIKIINLIQKQAKKYQLKGQNQLIIKEEMPEDIRRIELIENLLKTLS